MILLIFLHVVLLPIMVRNTSVKVIENLKPPQKRIPEPDKILKNAAEPAKLQARSFMQPRR